MRLIAIRTSGFVRNARNSCVKKHRKLRNPRYDEAACLIDFGVSPEVGVGSLETTSTLLRQAVKQRKRRAGRRNISIPAFDSTP